VPSSFAGVEELFLPTVDPTGPWQTSAITISPVGWNGKSFVNAQGARLTFNSCLDTDPSGFLWCGNLVAVFDTNGNRVVNNITYLTTPSAPPTDTDGDGVPDNADNCPSELEGVVAKRKDSLYEPGERSDAWQKLKLENQQEFVIGGYRSGSNGIDALLVGYYDDSGFRFAGKVRAGFVPHLRREVLKALKRRHVDQCAFLDLPNPKSSRWGGGVTAGEMREMQWVTPELVAQIRFVEWTAEGRLRRIPGSADGQERARGAAGIARSWSESRR
jgi:hypothetical protein